MILDDLIEEFTAWDSDTVMIAGGACRDRFLGKDTCNDVDLFLTDPAGLQSAVGALETLGYVQVFACPNKELFTYRIPVDGPIETPAKLSSHDDEAESMKPEDEMSADEAAVVLSELFQKLMGKPLSKAKTVWTGIPVHIINKRTYADIHECIDTFDFTVCQFGWSLPTGFVHTERAARDVADRRLALHRLTYPIATLRRMRKYFSYGYVPAEGFYLALFEAIRTGSFSDDFLVYSLD